jgi:hypothetical protein
VFVNNRDTRCTASHCDGWNNDDDGDGLGMILIIIQDDRDLDGDYFN